MICHCVNKYIEIIFCLIFISLTTFTHGQKSTTKYRDSQAPKNINKAYPIFFQKLGSEEELPKAIRGVLKDRKGFLWINTDEGVYRYDGIHFDKIKFNPQDTASPAANLYQSIVLGRSSDTIWAVGAYSEPCYFDISVDRFKSLPMKLAKEIPQDKAMKYILEDSRGMVWVSMSNDHGLNLFDPVAGQLSQTEIYKHFPKDFMIANSLLEDSQGNIWVISHNLACLTFKKGNREITGIKHYPELVMSPVFGPDPIRRLTEDADKNIWAGGFEGHIYRIDPKENNVTKFSDERLVAYQETTKRNGRVNGLVVADDGKIWMANEIGGVSIFDPATAKFMTHRFNKFDPLSIGSDNVTGVFKDETGIIWISTDNGLNFYNPKAAAFGHFRSVANNAQSLSSNVVQSFFEDAQGNVWIGTKNGLNKFDRQTGSFTQYFPPASIIQNKNLELLSITQAPADSPFIKDKLWIGSSGGLLIFDPESGTFSKWEAPDEAAKPMETDQIHSFAKDKNGTIWANTFKTNPYRLHRVFRFDSDMDTFREIELLTSDSIAMTNYIFPDNHQNYWIYSNKNGLYRLDLNTGKQIFYDIKPNELEGTIEPSLLCTIWKDAQNRYWLGGSGLFLLTPIPNKTNEYSFEDLIEEAGLINGYIYGMLEDDEGQVWISSSKGIVKMNPYTLTFHNYQKADGLQGLAFNERAFYKSPTTDDIYLGGRNGFNAFHPNDIQKDTIPPPVSITSIGIFRDSVMQQFIFENLKNENGEAEIALFYGDKLLEINYAALHFADPKRNQYAIQMEGYDKNWRHVGNETETTYTNLDAGEYHFRLKAANKDGVWNEESTSLKVIVHPPWWATWWAYATYFILVASAIYFFYKFQLKRNTEKAEAVYLKEMDKVKTQFFSNITHEFRTPLTLILGPAKQLHDEETQPKKQKRLAGIVKNANHLLGLINQLLDLSKLEGNQMSIEIKRGDLIEYTAELVDIFRPLAKQKAQNLQFVTNQEAWVTNFDQDKWNKIIFNLLSNAIKFTPKEGNIELNLSNLLEQEQDWILLIVKDYGQGIEKENLNQIFNRFYQVDASATRIQEGAGIGLALVKELVELQGGSIQVDSEVGKGTSFEIKIPVLQSTEKIGDIQTDSLKNFPIWMGEKSDILSEPTESSKELLEVLIIEDNIEMGEYISSCLDPKQYKISIAQDGEEGIQKAFETIPDLIICDVMMPKKDGFEVVTAIRENISTSHIPVVLLTAKAALESRLEGLERGADAYLTKPFSPEELVLRIRKLIELRQSLQRRYQNQEHEIDKNTESFPKEDAFITNLKAFITENIDNSNLTVVEISEHFFMSRVQLYRKLKALTDDSVSVFIRKVRLEVALELIKAKELNLSEIAYQTGFSSPAYFSTAFKQQYGKTPSEIGSN